MTEADLADIGTLKTGGSRGPRDWIEWNCRNYAEHGFGLWVLETHAGEFVGDCGLTMQEVDGEEAGIDHLIAIIRPDNVASRSVAARIGLVLEREVEKNGGPCRLASDAQGRSASEPGFTTSLDP